MKNVLKSWNFVTKRLHQKYLCSFSVINSFAFLSPPDSFRNAILGDSKPN